MMRIKVRYFIVGFLFGCCFPLGAMIFEFTRLNVDLSWEVLLQIHQNNPIIFMIDSAPLFLGIFAYLGGISKAKSVQLIGRFIQVSEILSKSNGKVQKNTDQILESLNKAIHDVRNDYSLLFDVYSKSNSGIEETMNTARQIEQRISEMKEKLNLLFKNQAIISKHNQQIKEYLERYIHEFNSLLSHLDFLEDFSYQIEMLAVNSSIEASHFGEQGKVFQVFSKNIHHLVQGTKKRNQIILKMVGNLNEETRDLFQVIQDESVTVQEMSHMNRKIDELSDSFNELSFQFISSLQGIITQLREQDCHSTSFDKAICKMSVASQEMLDELQTLISGQSGIIHQMRNVT